MTLFYIVVMNLIGCWFLLRLSHWKWSACTCGRSKFPWFNTKHEKHWVMIGLLLVCIAFCAINVVGHALFGQFLWAGTSLWQLKIIIEHGKGRRKWLEKAQGLVTINKHGRLVVSNG